MKAVPSVSAADAVVLAAKTGLTPLEYMLDVMNDPNADVARRDRLAIAAAPFMHPRLGDASVGKRDQQEAKAKAASEGRFSVPSGPRLVANNS